MNLRKLQDLSLSGKRVLLRVDYNVPLNEDGSILDDTRIRESIPSIQYILDHGGSVILISHLGRPKEGFDPNLSLRCCVQPLSTLLNRPIEMAEDCIGENVEKKAKDLKPGQVLLLENLRFHAAEENPSLDPSFAEKLSKLADLYVDDAFATAHRKHSSTVTIASFFPHRTAAGFLIQKEIEFLQPLISHPKKPFYAIIGGAKISTKIGVLKALLSKIDGIFIGGAMAFTFFKAQGIAIGDSLCEKEHIPTAREFLKLCKEQNCALFLPQDLRIADAFKNEANQRLISIEEGIPDKWQGMDIGPQTIETWKKHLSPAQTIFWNGPLGVFEFPAFAKGTEAIATFLSTLSATTIIGGGDSVAAIQKLGLGKQFSHLSTGGGASLEYLEFGHLPGIDVLRV